jgi:hypothetical protein
MKTGVRGGGAEWQKSADSVEKAGCCESCLSAAQKSFDFGVAT